MSQAKLSVSNQAPVVMVGYSRFSTLTKSLGRLAKCNSIQQRDVFLFLDAPYRNQDNIDCEKMYQVAMKVKSNTLSNLHVIRREKNYGAPGNLISAVTEIAEKYGRLIFFEDDVLVSRTFLDYMDQSLDLYETDKRIFCVNGFKSPYIKVPSSYIGDVYLTKRNAAWGFGIWRDRWGAVDFDMSDWAERQTDSQFIESLKDAGLDVPGMVSQQKNGNVHTWDIQCTYHMVKNGLYAIEPRYSLTKNIGFGFAGVHCTMDVPFFSRMKYYNFIPRLEREHLFFDKRMALQIRRALMTDSLLQRCYRKLRRCCAYFSRVHMDPDDVC